MPKPRSCLLFLTTISAASLVACKASENGKSPSRAEEIVQTAGLSPAETGKRVPVAKELTTVSTVAGVARPAPEEPPRKPGPASPSAAAAQARTDPSSPGKVTVRAGESMGLYAKWAKLPMREIYARADVDWNATLRPGQVLALRLSEGERTRFENRRAAFHDRLASNIAGRGTRSLRARPGDSGWRISRRLGVPLSALQRLNPNRDLSKLSVGDLVKVPSADKNRM